MPARVWSAIGTDSVKRRGKINALFSPEAFFPLKDREDG